ncbi:endo-beta-N-acetylglucosaminidase H [Microbacterium sp. CFBP9023]|uniref:endo-beta-N-acetylglucosaminidase H n=1 Tax=Microbacterium sp. CFBP9023 TaxID=3096535 RepID=UPI002A6A3039|nr:endo-beta-N-acetylglucosaminidase H [Microbacterium sp. CFBP9023]MDY0983530.1 endo-beta-N-acetylglucosaminidase H [Microbacterium sp. CFBP9023]
MNQNVRNHRFRKGIAGLGVLATAAAGMLAGTTGAAADTTEPVDPQLAVYVEVNSNDLANVADYTLAESGDAAIDMAMIFAANINYDGEKAYLHFNERVTETLDNAETQIRPVQENGTKVLLSVLGNHQGAGFANFTSYTQADAFAAQLADAVTSYGLDGIDFDDEWTEYGANGTPQPNPQSFGWLATALRDRLGPDKIISLYAIGPSYTTTDFALFDAAGVLDYAWNPYYPTYDAPTVPGLEDRTRLGAAAIDLSNTSAATAEDFATRTVADGYGVYVAYNLTATDQSAYLSGITEALKGEATEYRAAPRDTTSPTVTIKDGARFTKVETDGSYQRVSYKLFDEGKIDRLSVNGVVKDLSDDAWSDLNFVKPGVFGAVVGENTLQVVDVAGNVTELSFVLSK